MLCYNTYEQELCFKILHLNDEIYKILDRVLTSSMELYMFILP